MNNKSIFANNLNKHMTLRNITRRDLCAALGFSYYTVSDWCNGKKYPRMDKVEILANYFGIQKSDLIEEAMVEEKKEDNEILAEIIVRMRMDDEFRSLVESIYLLDSDKIQGVKQLLQAFAK